jgi:Spy/CpxP family protein refolding chaperone
MNNKVLIILLVISVAINIMAGVMFGRFLWQVHVFKSRGGPPMMGPFPDWGKGMMRQELNLSDDQIEELNAMQKKLEPEILALREELERTRREMFLIWKASEPDTVKAESLYQHLYKVQKDLDAHLFKHLKGIHNVLTPIQREKLFEMLEKPPFPPKSQPRF